MLGLLGAVFVLVSILLFAWAVLAFRNPHGPAWRNRYLVLEAAACAIVALFVFGLAMQLKFALDFPGAMGGALSAAALVFALAAYFVVWRWLGVPAKLAQFDAAEAAMTAAAPPAAKRSKATA